MDLTLKVQGLQKIIGEKESKTISDITRATKS